MDKKSRAKQGNSLEAIRVKLAEAETSIEQQVKILNEAQINIQRLSGAIIAYKDLLGDKTSGGNGTENPKALTPPVIVTPDKEKRKYVKKAGQPVEQIN